MNRESPCVAVCIIDPARDLCLGCGRTLGEIAGWHRLTPTQRPELMATLPARMRDAGLLQAGPGDPPLDSDS